VARPPLREDALRQRAARARLPARLAGDERAAVQARNRGNARLGAARDARARGRLLLGARRRLRGRRGQVLRVVARRGPLSRGRGRRGVVRRDCGGQLRGREHPDARRGRARAARRVAGQAVRRAQGAGLARTR
jgi:hypothetical protein